MTWTGWLAISAACAMGLLPAAGAVRVGALSERGRLGGVAAVGAGRLAIPPALSTWLMRIVAGAVVGSVALWTGPLLSVAAGAVLLTVGVLLGDLRKRRRATLLHRDLLTAVRVLVAELEAGSASAAALCAAGEAALSVSERFAAAGEAARRGESPGPVLIEDGNAGIRAVGLALSISDSTGAGLAGVVGRVAADLEAAEEQRRSVAIALAGPRSSAFVLSCLPMLGIGLGVAMGARPLAVLTGTSGGRAVCCAGVLLDVAGILWIRRIVTRAESLR